jgi:hypothetical protein
MAAQPMKIEIGEAEETVVDEEHIGPIHGRAERRFRPKRRTLRDSLAPATDDSAHGASLMLCNLSHHGESVPISALRRCTMRKVAYETQALGYVPPRLSTDLSSRSHLSAAIGVGKPPEALGKLLVSCL